MRWMIGKDIYFTCTQLVYVVIECSKKVVAVMDSTRR